MLFWKPECKMDLRMGKDKFLQELVRVQLDPPEALRNMSDVKGD